jgi:hypothetical protein
MNGGSRIYFKGSVYKNKKNVNRGERGAGEGLNILCNGPYRD